MTETYEEQMEKLFIVLRCGRHTRCGPYAPQSFIYSETLKQWLSPARAKEQRERDEDPNHACVPDLVVAYISVALQHGHGQDKALREFQQWRVQNPWRPILAFVKPRIPKKFGIGNFVVKVSRS